MRKKRVVLWYTEDEPIEPTAGKTLTVHELEPPPPLILDHRGNPIARIKQRMWFL